MTGTNYSFGDIGNSLSVRILTAESKIVDDQWNAADVCTTFWRFYVNEEDGCRVRVADTVYELPAGQIHIIPAWVTFSCLNDRPLQHFYIHFDLMGVSAASVRRCFPKPLSLGIDHNTESILAQCKNGNGLEQILTTKALVYLALSRVLSLLPSHHRTELELHRQDVFNGLMMFIENNLSNRLRNSDLARFCNLSEDHFIKRFKDILKVSPGQYLSERRVAKAAELLIFSDESIEGIADACGFANRHYFTRVFSKLMGVPPGQFRKSSHP